MGLDYADSLGDLNARPILSEEGRIYPGAPLRNSTGDAPVGDFALPRLQELIELAGLEDEFDFVNPPMKLRRELDRLRAFLWPKAANGTAGFRNWARVAGPYLLETSSAGGPVADLSHRLLDPNGFYREVDFIYPVSASTPEGRVKTEVSRGEGAAAFITDAGVVAGGAATFPAYRWTYDDRAGVTFRVRVYSVEFVLNVGPGNTVAGVSSTQPFFSPLLTFFGATSPAGVCSVFCLLTGESLPQHPLEFRHNITVTGGLTLLSATRHIRSLSAYVVSPFSVGNASGGLLARVLSRKPNWQRHRAGDVLLERLGEDLEGIGTEIPLQHTYTAEDPAGNLPGYWRGLMPPAQSYEYEAMAAESELWRYSRRNLHGEASYPLITAPARTTPATILRVHTPHQASLAQITDYGTKLGALADWANYRRIAVTVPAALTGQNQELDFPKLFCGVELANTMRCDWYKVALPDWLRPEQEGYVTWDFGVGNPDNLVPNPAQGFETADRPPVGEDDGPGASGRQADEYFHDARLVTPDFRAFWYRDVVAHMGLEPPGLLRRFPAWMIRREEGRFYLYLVKAYHNVKVGENPDGSPVFGDVAYQPTGVVTVREFRDAYLQSPSGFDGNQADFIAPYRFFDTGDAASSHKPIAAWTVGKQIGGPWVPGTALVLHVSEASTRGPSSSFRILNQGGVDATLDNEAREVPDPTVARHSEIHEVWVERRDRRMGLLVFRNRKARIHLDHDASEPGGEAHPEDIRIHHVRQTDVYTNGYVTENGLRPGYETEFIDAYRDLGAAAGVRLNDGQWSYDRETHEITLLDDALGTDEFVTAFVSYRSYYGGRPEIRINLGRWGDVNGVTQFTPWRSQFIESKQQFSPTFYLNEGDEEAEIPGSLSPRWIVSENLPLVYQKVLGPVDVDIAQEPHEYTVDGRKVPGIRVSVNTDVGGADEGECTVRYRAGWRRIEVHTYAEWQELIDPAVWTPEEPWGLAGDIVAWPGQRRRTISFRNPEWGPEERWGPSFEGGVLKLHYDGEEPAADHEIIAWFGFYSVTETHFFEGRHWVPPSSSNNAHGRSERLSFFEFISARQRFDVRVRWREVWTSLPGPEIVGLAFAEHANETTLLLKAWIDQGMPE